MERQKFKSALGAYDIGMGQVKLTLVCLISALVISLFPPFVQKSSAQEPSIEQTENTYKDLFGVDRLKALNTLTYYYQSQNERKALRYGRQAVALGENIFTPTNTTVDLNQSHHLAMAYLQLGKVLYNKEDFFESRKNLVASISLSRKIGNKTHLVEAETYLNKIQALIASGEIKEGFLSKTLGTLQVGKAISETTKDLGILTEIKLGKSNENRGDFLKAIEHYEKAINLLRNQGDADRIGELQLRIAQIYDSLDQHIEAQRFLGKVITDKETALTKSASNLSINGLSEYDLEIGTEKKDKESLRIEQKELKNLAESYARKKDFEKSLAYYKLYQELSLKMETDSLEKLAENRQKEGEIVLLKQQKEIADLNVSVIEKEKERQIRLRNTSALLALVILLSTIGTLYLYMTKRRQHKKLSITHRDLNKAKVRLVDAEQRIAKLLTQQVSADVAQELILNGSDKPGRHFVCIMFLDIRDFTPMAEKLSPEELISYQNEVFGFMIDIIQSRNGNINQLLGDGFMATFGAPVSHGNDCQNAFFAAREILSEVKERSDAGIIQKTKIGIGLHAGYVVTGNVGNESRKQYSVTGNPVIIASRIEQLNKEYQTQLIITKEVYQKLDEFPLHGQTFLEVKVKGRLKPIQILKIA